ncbi:hypothetical protein DFO70_106263 [Cytobacillus firmus]|uniref:Uncharacterized protein n=2 Tax=Cytobacillus TaxID=2675230 RepID=A0A366JWZ3_CYTFI|nr:hypothetical protein DFO70_106263 [Cytobacillus firmus]TDX42733.1 hypothetical protein DFO72_106263 [Cytobacillus oceanisediminis]
MKSATATSRFVIGIARNQGGFAERSKGTLVYNRYI